MPTIQLDDALGTGLNEPTAAQKEWMRKNVPFVKDVKMNALALERANQERAAKGLPGLEAADAGAAGEGSGPGYDSGYMSSDGYLPTYVDNSKSTAFPVIRSQGGIGSCVAWSTTYYAFTYETNLARGRVASTGDNNMIFSPKWTYNMINYGTDGGAYFSDAFNLLTKHGAATWAEFPYDTNYLQWCLNTATWRNAINYRALSWGQIYNTDTAALIVQLKTQLANGHVMVIGTYVTSWVSAYIKNDASTAEDDAFVNQRIATYMKNTRQGGHGMTLVGYSDSIWCDLNNDGDVDPGEKGAFKIANSWGTGDWNGGYRWVTYDSLWGASQVHSTASWPTSDRDSRGIFRGGDIYTLTVRTSYTPKVVAEFTINTLKRGQLYMTLGIGDVTATVPSTTWSGRAIYGSGGSLAFDGTTVARDGTFVFDFTDIVPSVASAKRWFVGMRDSMAGDQATMKAFRLYEVTGGGDVLVASSAGVPKTADGSQAHVWVDYQYNSLNNPPTAVARATPTSGTAPITVTFDGTGSSDADGTITSFQWGFGDGSSGSGATVAHTYINSGSYTATLTVTDDDGAKGSSGILITVGLPNSPPIASARASPTSGFSPLTVAFDGGASIDSDGSIVSYAWNFGDGTTATGSSASHTYGQAGTYTATLTVTDDDGASGSSNVVITVTESAPTTINAPSNLVAQAASGSIRLSWKDNSNNEGGFRIERGMKWKGAFTFTLVAIVGANVNAYTDTVNRGTYIYRVCAVDANGAIASAYSNPAYVHLR